MNNAVEIYAKRSQYPRLLVMQHVIERAVRALARSENRIEALALIRGAYMTDDGAWASLKEAQSIYESMIRSVTSFKSRREAVTWKSR